MGKSVRVRDIDRWRARDILRLIGGALTIAPLIILIPTVGSHTGRSYEPGSDAARGFSIAMLRDNPLALGATIAIAVGVVLFLVAGFFPEDVS